MSSLKILGLILIMSAAPVEAQQVDDKVAGPNSDILVSGTSLKDVQARLRSCLDQRCPPDKDIDASLLVAETQFVLGNYKGARTTLLRSVSRNKRYAKHYPVAVSGLLRADARVAAHLGRAQANFSDSLDMVSALKAGLPESDARVLEARIELGDAYARAGRLDAAVGQYDAVAARARDLGLSKTAGYALFRIALVNAAASALRGDEYYQAAVRASDRLIGERDPAMTPYATAAKVLKTQLGIRPGDQAAADRLVATYGSLARESKEPVLLYAPKLGLPPLSGHEFSDGETLSKLALDDFDDQWVDISFRITPDGKVADAEVSQKSPKLVGDWVSPILASIKGRRYAPVGVDGGGLMRIERYTFTSSWTTTSGSRIDVRSPIPRIEMLDLSLDRRS